MISRVNASNERLSALTEGLFSFLLVLPNSTENNSYRVCEREAPLYGAPMRMGTRFPGPVGGLRGP